VAPSSLNVRQGWLWSFRALFLLCDAMQMRPMSTCGVCVSITLVYSVKTNKDNLKIFSPSGSQAILVFSILLLQSGALLVSTVHTNSADTFLTFNNRLKTELFQSCYSNWFWRHRSSPDSLANWHVVRARNLFVLHCICITYQLSCCPCHDCGGHVLRRSEAVDVVDRQPLYVLHINWLI